MIEGEKQAHTQILKLSSFYHYFNDNLPVDYITEVVKACGTVDVGRSSAQIVSQSSPPNSR